MHSAGSNESNIGLSRQEFCDIDEQAACLTGHDQKYQQLSRGQFNGQFSTALLGPDLGVYFERLNQVLDQSGAVPRDQYSVVFLMNHDAPCKLNGRAFSSDDVLFAGPGSSFHTLSRPGTHFCVVSVKKDYFEPIDLALRGDGGSGFEAGREGTGRADRANAKHLRRLAQHACSIFEAGPGATQNPATLSGLHASLTQVMSNCATAAARQPSCERQMSRVSHLQTVQKARAYIHENAENDISIASLCSHVGVSRRALEYSFQVCLEQSPAAYLRMVRLNEIRRALQLPQNIGRSIGDIAAQWGVWHLSRFAQYYQSQFGELPSQTRSQLKDA